MHHEWLSVVVCCMQQWQTRLQGVPYCIAYICRQLRCTHAVNAGSRLQHPVQCWYTGSGLIWGFTFGPKFHFSMTPGLKFSTSTSTLFESSLMIWRPSSCLMSTVMHLLLRPCTWQSIVTDNDIQRMSGACADYLPGAWLCSLGHDMALYNADTEIDNRPHNVKNPAVWYKCNAMSDCLSLQIGLCTVMQLHAKPTSAQDRLLQQMGCATPRKNMLLMTCAYNLNNCFWR